MAEKKLYQYDPSLAAAIIFLVIFAASAVLHTWQIIRTKNWYFIPFLVGTLGKFPHGRELQVPRLAMHRR